MFFHPPPDIADIGELYRTQPRRVLVEGHMTYCCACRETWADCAAPGGRLLDEAHDEAPPPRLYDGLLARIRNEEQAADPYEGLPLSGKLLACLPRNSAWMS